MKTHLRTKLPPNRESTRPSPEVRTRRPGALRHGIALHRRRMLPEVEIPRSYVPSSRRMPQDVAGFGAPAGARAGRDPVATLAVVLGAGASLVIGVSGSALAAATIDAPPPGSTPAPRDAASSPRAVSGDTSAPVEVARAILFPGDTNLSTALDQARVAPLVRGDTGPAVTELQTRLTGIGIPVAATGEVGPTTEQAIETFQTKYQIPITGKFDGRSLDTLRAAEAVTDPGRHGTGRAFINGKDVGEVQLLYVNGNPVSVEAANALRPMFVVAARQKHPIALGVVSGYRTYDEQAALYDNYLHHGGNLAARPGYSNHESGIAVDLNTSDRGVYAWLTKNARSFGFHRTVKTERWHWELIQ